MHYQEEENLRAGQGLIRAGEIFLGTFSNFEIQIYYQNEPEFNGVY